MRFFLLISAVFINSFASTTYYNYEKSVKGKKTPMKWTIEQKKEKLFLTCTEDIGITKMTALPEYKKILNYAFSSHDKKYGYSIDLKNKHLAMEKKDGGQTGRSSFKISRPWIQQFGFGLMPFVRSSKKSLKFCLINTDKSELVNMIAEKLEKKSLKINGKEYQAQRVKVTLSGFKSMFWKAEMWFNQENGDLLKYAADSGPGTPVTVITFVDKKQPSFLQKIKKKL